MKSFTGLAVQLLNLQNIALFTCCIDLGVGAIPGVERVTHSSISRGHFEIFVTAWRPLPPTTNKRVMCTWVITGDYGTKTNTCRTTLS